MAELIYFQINTITNNNKSLESFKFVEFVSFKSSLNEIILRAGEIGK